MIQNILVEASRGEVVLTSRPRVITLPPLSFPRWERSGLPPRGQRRKGATGGRGGLTWPEASPSPLPGICIFQDRRSRLAAGGVLRVTANRDVPAGGAVPYRLFADASAQPLLLPSLGSDGPLSTALPVKHLDIFFYICLDFISPTREQFARAERDRWWERPRRTAAIHWRLRGLGGCASPLHTSAKREVSPLAAWRWAWSGQWRALPAGLAGLAPGRVNAAGGRGAS